MDKDISKNEIQGSNNNSYIEDNKFYSNNNVDKIIDNINADDLNFYSSNKINFKNIDYLKVNTKNLDNFENILENARIQNGGKKSKSSLKIAKLRSNSNGNLQSYTNNLIEKNNNLRFRGKDNYSNNNLVRFQNKSKLQIVQQKGKSPNFIGERKFSGPKKSFISYQSNQGRKEYDRKFKELTLKEVENTIKIIDESTQKKESMDRIKTTQKKEKEESFWDKLFKPFRCDYKCDN